MPTYRLIDADLRVFEEIADDGNVYRSFTVGETSDYKALREDVITNSGAALDVDVPDWLQADADQFVFDKQLADYKAAKARLEQYVVADGRAEVRESEPTDELVVNEETGEKEKATREVVTVTAIDPVDATVEQTTFDEDGNATTTTIENPLITKDNEERAAAQAVVDATPQNVRDAVDN